MRSALRGPEVSVVVPALNEALNLPELAARIAASLAGRAYEIIIVDDGSADGTHAVCDHLALTYPLTLVVRDTPRDGLSGAVLRGLSEARGDWLVVLDADLQHPPESIPLLLEPLEAGSAEFALGSRYVAGGSTEEGWSWFRRANSRIATLLARPVAGRTRDPMSGFFALHRDTFRRARQLTPLGYKIGLELMCKCGVGAVCEVPIRFANRHEGESKLGVRQQIKYLEHLSRLYDFQLPAARPDDQVRDRHRRRLGRGTVALFDARAARRRQDPLAAARLSALRHLDRRLPPALPAGAATVRRLRRQLARFLRHRGRGVAGLRPWRLYGSPPASPASRRAKCSSSPSPPPPPPGTSCARKCSRTSAAFGKTTPGNRSAATTARLRQTNRICATGGLPARVFVFDRENTGGQAAGGTNPNLGT